MWITKKKKKSTKNAILNTQRISGSLNDFNVLGVKKADKRQ